jgi:putative two-component system response regulator
MPPSTDNPGSRTGSVQHIVSTFHLMIVAEQSVSDRLASLLAPFGYRLQVESSSESALQSIYREPPDILLLSSGLAPSGPFPFLRSIRTNPLSEGLPVMIVLGQGAKDQEARAFQLGAEDVVHETTSELVLRARVRVLLRLSTYRRRLQNEKRRLEIRVADRTRELFEITIATVAALEKATEMSDQETGHHMMRVADYSALLAEEMGVGLEMCEKIRLYAPLHDVGKVGVKHEILKKEGVLTRVEFEEMKKHTVFGYELLSAARADDVARNIALSHHERIDGSGYPHGLHGTAIPLEARVVAVADVFDALTTQRRYKDAMDPDEAHKMISLELGTRFDPQVLGAFTRRFQDIISVFQSYSR